MKPKKWRDLNAQYKTTPKESIKGRKVEIPKKQTRGTNPTQKSPQCGCRIGLKT